MKLLNGFLKVLHGLLFGVGTGLILGFLFAWVNPPSGHGDMYAVLFVFLLCSVLGGIFGILFALSTWHSRRISKLIAIAAYLYVAVALVLFLYSYYGSWQRETEGMRRRAEFLVPIMAAWDQSYGAAYPMVEESLPALLGPLHYPESRLVEWLPLDPDNEFRWVINVASDDDMEAVLAYYMTVLPEGLELDPLLSLEEESGFESQPQESADSRITTVRIRVDEGHVRIKYVTKYQATAGRPSMGGEPVPTAWPESEEIHRDRVEKFQRPSRERITNELEPLTYPGTRMVSTRVTYAQASIDTWVSYEHLPLPPNGVYISTDLWQTIFDYLSAQLGRPAAAGKFFFRGDITDSAGNPVTLIVIVDPKSTMWGALGGVVLDYVVVPVEPEPDRNGLRGSDTQIESDREEDSATEFGRREGRKPRDVANDSEEAIAPTRTDIPNESQ